MSSSEQLSTCLARGVVAGLAGTAVMTAFQYLVEMPITRREESFAPADLAAKLLPLHPADEAARRRVNLIAHFALGTGWGVARGVAGHAGLREQAAVAAVFAGMYPGDVMLATALGVYSPGEWSALDIAIDVVDKLVQAEATGVAYDMLERRQAA